MNKKCSKCNIEFITKVHWFTRCESCELKRVNKIINKRRKKLEKLTDGLPDSAAYWWSLKMFRGN